MAGDASSASMTNKNGQQLFTDIKTEDEGIEFYASAQHPKLNLSMRNLGDAVTAKLAKAFTEIYSSSVTWLDLSCNSIGAEGAAAIGKLLETSGCKLFWLDLSANFIGDDGAKTIADALVNNSSLAHLDMHSCGIRDRGLGSISAMLKSNKSVESLNLRANYIQDYGIQVLAEAITENNTLKELNVHSNDFSRTGGDVLMGVLREHPTIRSHGHSGPGLEEACAVQ